MKIRAVIVEDSRLARNELKELIKLHDDLELVGEAGNVDDGAELIETEIPDLLFLDINMPEKDGFDLLEMLDDVPITVLEHSCIDRGQNRANLDLIAPLLGLIIPNAPN